VRLTKRQLKRVIREEYSKLKRRGMIKESYEESFEPFEFGSDYAAAPAADSAGMGQACMSMSCQDLMMMICEVCEANIEFSDACCDLVIAHSAKDSVGCDEALAEICTCPTCKEICSSYCGV
jgi:hypothetical protein